RVQEFRKQILERSICAKIVSAGKCCVGANVEPRRTAAKVAAQPVKHQRLVVETPGIPRTAALANPGVRRGGSHHGKQASGDGGQQMDMLMSVDEVGRTIECRGEAFDLRANFRHKRLTVRASGEGREKRRAERLKFFRLR